MREDDSNWFSRWEEELPSPKELMPLLQTLITPDLAMAFNIRNSHTTNTAEQQHQNQQPPPQQQPSNHSLALQSCMNCHRRFPSIATKPKIVMLLWPSHERSTFLSHVVVSNLLFSIYFLLLTILMDLGKVDGRGSADLHSLWVERSKQTWEL